MAKKNGFVLTGSVQEKNGKLYLVYPHYDPIKQVAKPKWKSMGLYEGEKKAVIEKKKRELLRELEAEETRLREGYDNPRIILSWSSSPIGWRACIGTRFRKPPCRATASRSTERSRRTSAAKSRLTIANRS